MNKVIFFLGINLLFSNTSFCQDTWFDKNVSISQSMETAEQKKESAQFQITLPKNGTNSWLANVGVSVKIGSSSERLISKLTTEYHRNTLTAKKQNNFTTGYTFKYLFPGGKKTDWLALGDVKYLYDGIDIKNSVAANLLFTFSNDESKFLHWNANKYFKGGRASIWASLIAGAQLQNIFNAKNDSAKGLILRPLFMPSLIFDIYKKDSSTTIVRFSINYTGRKDIINSTKFSEENYTQFFKTGVEFFLAYAPVKVSLGASFNYGSDPLKGLKHQQFWLLSVNFQK